MIKGILCFVISFYSVMCRYKQVVCSRNYELNEICVIKGIELVVYYVSDIYI